MWEGSLLIQNLSLLNELTKEGFEIYEIVAENLFTCFNFDIENQTVQINSEILDKETCRDLCVLYAKQYETYMSLEKSVEKHKQIKFVALPMLMNEGFDMLELKDLVTLIQLIGPLEKHYPKEFIEKFNGKDFEILES